MKSESTPQMILHTKVIYPFKTNIEQNMKKNILATLMCAMAILSCADEENDLCPKGTNYQKSYTEVESTALDFANSILQVDEYQRTRASNIKILETKKLNVQSTRADSKDFFSVSLTEDKGTVLMMKDAFSATPLAYFMNETGINYNTAIEDTTDLGFLVDLAISYGMDLPEGTPSTRSSQSWNILSIEYPKCKTWWHQLSPYNQKCKDKNGNTLPAGCIAVAGAQALSVLRPSLSFISDWPAVISAGISSSYVDEISTLIHEVGIQSGIDYNNGKTGTIDLQQLVNYFSTLNISRCKDEYILDVIKSFHGVAIATGYRARHGWLKKHYYDGHAFLLDGYVEFDKRKGNNLDNDRFYMHINYGQPGHDDRNNGVYLLSSQKAWDENIADTASDIYTEYKFKVTFYPFARNTELNTWWKL